MAPDQTWHEQVMVMEVLPKCLLIYLWSGLPTCRCVNPPLCSRCACIWHSCVTLLHHVTCCIWTHAQYNSGVIYRISQLLIGQTFLFCLNIFLKLGLNETCIDDVPCPFRWTLYLRMWFALSLLKVQSTSECTIIHRNPYFFYGK